MKTLNQKLSFSICVMTEGMVRDLRRRMKRGLTKREAKLFKEYIARLPKGGPNE